MTGASQGPPCIDCGAPTPERTNGAAMSVERLIEAGAYHHRCHRCYEIAYGLEPLPPEALAAEKRLAEQERILLMESDLEKAHRAAEHPSKNVRDKARKDLNRRRRYLRHLSAAQRVEVLTAKLARMQQQEAQAKAAEAAYEV